MARNLACHSGRHIMGMRGDAGQVKQCVSCRGENFEMFKILFRRCHDLSRPIVECTLGVTQFVNSSKMARLDTPYCGTLRGRNSCQCEACLYSVPKKP